MAPSEAQEQDTNENILTNETDRSLIIYLKMGKVEKWKRINREQSETGTVTNRNGHEPERSEMGTFKRGTVNNVKVNGKKRKRKRS